MRFWIDILDATHNILGDGPINSATRCTSKARVNRVGEFSFEMPATDPRAALVVARRLAMMYSIQNGHKTFIGGGPVDKIITRVNTSGVPMLQVSGSDMLDELTRISVGKLTLSGSGNANVATLMSIVSASPLNWSTSTEPFSPDFVAKFVYETVFNSLFAVADKTGAYFIYDRTNAPSGALAWFYSIGDSGILATMHGDAVALESNADVCLITDIEVDQDSNDLKTRAFLFGAGEGDSVMTAYFASQWPDGSAIANPYTVGGATFQLNKAGNYLINTAGESAYGRDEVALAFKDIAPLTNIPFDLVLAANYLVTAGVQYLFNNRQPFVSYKVTIAGLKRPLNPGQSILIQARRYRDGQKPIDINQSLFILEVANSVDIDGVSVTTLTVANMNRWPINDNEVIARELAKTNVMSAHPQTGPNVDTISYREHLDGSHQATLYFWLGNETTTVQSVFVRFHVDPLRSTVTATGSASQTTSGGSAHTHTIPDHSHGFIVAGIGVTALAPVKLDPSGGVAHLYYDGTGDRTQSTTVNPGTATGSSESTHTHSVTPVVTPVWGVFDQSGALTYAATDLEWKTEADSTWTAITSADAISGAAGWYGIDITARIAANQLPNSVVNDVQFRIKAASVAAGKSAQLTVQIERRTSIQSIAVY